MEGRVKQEYRIEGTKKMPTRGGGVKTSASLSVYKSVCLSADGSWREGGCVRRGV
jgi:hypothetical protein